MGGRRPVPTFALHPISTFDIPPPLRPDPGPAAGSHLRPPPMSTDDLPPSSDIDAIILRFLHHFRDPRDAGRVDLVNGHRILEAAAKKTSYVVVPPIDSAAATHPPSASPPSNSRIPGVPLIDSATATRPRCPLRLLSTRASRFAVDSSDQPPPHALLLARPAPPPPLALLPAPQPPALLARPAPPPPPPLALLLSSLALRRCRSPSPSTSSSPYEMLQSGFFIFPQFFQSIA
uniref:Uncharacterized protein n=1 Tax=Setaria viridis TaxID=4556 RepID=A0A4U6SYR4_SETVI|nr:hypothetical protein SEVIR_9G278400v2 [Setaria viridis]